MQKGLIALFVLLFLSNASFASTESFPPTESFSPLSVMAEHATKSGHIPLVLGNLGFYVHVDFSNYTNEASETEDDDADSGNMVLALYTDQTFFGKLCQSSDYCQKHSTICNHELGQPNHFVFPYFETDAAPIGSQVFLDYSHWILKSTALVSSQCKPSFNYTTESFGLLGLGVTSLSQGNFAQNPNFAVHISKNLSNGTFTFNVDLSQAKSNTPTLQLAADNSWHISGAESMTVGATTFDVQTSIIFDLSSDSICLPNAIYQQVLDAIEKSPMIGGCLDGDDFRPTCNFTGDIRKLPTISINIGDQSLEIPPEVYVVQIPNENYFYYDPITLKLRKTSNAPAQGMYVTKQYENYIMLGYPVMSYYYTVFQAGPAGTDPVVNLYKSKEYVSASEMTWIFVLIGVAGLLVIGAIFYVIEKRYRKNKALNKPLLASKEHVKVKTVKGKRVQDSKAKSERGST